MGGWFYKLTEGLYCMKQKTKLQSDVVFLLPAMAFVLMAELVPIVYTTYLGFMQWNIITPPKWAGISNYIQIFSKPWLINAILNTFYWVIFTLIFAVGFSLFIAVLLNRVKGRAIFKAIFLSLQRFHLL